MAKDPTAFALEVGAAASALVYAIDDALEFGKKPSAEEMVFLMSAVRSRLAGLVDEIGEQAKALLDDVPSNVIEFPGADGEVA